MPGVAAGLSAHDDPIDAAQVEVVASLKHLFAEARAVFVADIDRAIVEAHMNRMADTGRGARTINKRLTHINGLFNRAVKTGAIPYNPVAGIERRRQHEKRRERRALTVEEARKLLAKAKRPDAKPGEHVAYALALCTGLRQNEIRHLIWADVDLDQKRLRVRARTEKARRGATLPIHPALASILAEWRNDNPTLPNSPVAELPDHPAAKLKATLAAAGIPYRDESGRYADFHSLRHTCLTLLEQSGCDLKTLQAIARHADVTLTMNVYVHRDRERERGAVASLPDLTCGGEQEATAREATNDAEAGVPETDVGRQADANVVKSRQDRGLRRDENGILSPARLPVPPLRLSRSIMQSGATKRKTRGYAIRTGEATVQRSAGKCIEVRWR